MYDRAKFVQNWQEVGHLWDITMYLVTDRVRECKSCNLRFEQTLTQNEKKSKFY